VSVIGVMVEKFVNEHYQQALTIRKTVSVCGIKILKQESSVYCA